MRLKPRLAALAALVTEGSIVADIGTGHAFLPIYLVREGLAGKVIAVENRQSTLERAQHSLNLFNQNYRINLRLGDGLGPIRREDGVETVVIAGMGGRTICRILLAAWEKWGWFQALVLQPMQDAALLRRWLAAHDLRLDSEKLVREGRKIYEIMVVHRGRQRIFDPVLHELGPCLVRERDPLLAPFIEQKIRRCRYIINALQDSGRSENRSKQAHFMEKEARLKEVLALVNDSTGHC